MQLTDLFLFLSLLQTFVPTIVTEGNLHKSPPGPQRAVFVSAHPRIIRRILHIGNESGRKDVIMAFPSYLKSQRPFHAHAQQDGAIGTMRPRLNIFGHYQHHQEVTPTQTAASERTNTFRPSPPDPLQIVESTEATDDQFTQLSRNVLQDRRISDSRNFPQGREISASRNVPQGRLISASRNVPQGRLISASRNIPQGRLISDSQHIYPRTENQNFRGSAAEDEISPQDEEELGSASRSSEGNFEEPEQQRFVPNAGQHRAAERENLIYYLYQSYLNSLANNMFRPRPLVQVIPRSEGKPHFEPERFEQDEIDGNLLTLRPPPLPTVPPPFASQEQFQEQTTFTTNANRNPTHFEVPIQPVLDAKAQFLEPDPFEQTVFQKQPVRSNGKHSRIHVLPELHSKSFQSFTTNADPILLRNAPNAQAPNSNLREAAPSQRQRTYAVENSEPNGIPAASRARNQIPSSNFGVENFDRQEIQNGRQQTQHKVRRPEVAQADAKRFQTVPETSQRPSVPSDDRGILFQARTNSIDPIQFQSRGSSRIQLMQLSGLPKVYPLTFSDGNKIQTSFLGPSTDSIADFEEIRPTTYSPRKSKPKPNGKSLYYNGKSLGKIGGLYAALPVLPQHHFYGIPIDAQPTPLQAIPFRRSEVKALKISQPLKTVHHGSQRQRHQSMAPSVNQVLSRTGTKTSKTNPRRKLNLGIESKGNDFGAAQAQALVSTPSTPIFEAPSTVMAPLKIETESITFSKSTSPARILMRKPSDRNPTSRQRSQVSSPKSRIVVTMALPLDEVSSDSDLGGVPETKVIESPEVATIAVPIPTVSDPGISSPTNRPHKVIIKKMRMRKPAVEVNQEHKRRKPTPPGPTAAENSKSKLTEFPNKYSSRYRTEAQILPTSIPTVTITSESTAAVKGQAQLTPARPFSSTPRRLPKATTSELPASVLLSPKDVLIKRKPARRIPQGSISERLKALKISASSNPNYSDTESNANVPTASKREITSVKNVDSKFSNEIKTLRMPEKANSTESEFSSEEMREFLGIPKATTLPSVPRRKSDDESLEGDAVDQKEKSVADMKDVDDLVDAVKNTQRQYLSIPIVSTTKAKASKI